MTRQEEDEAAVRRFVDWLMSDSSGPTVLAEVLRSGTTLPLRHRIDSAEVVIRRWVEHEELALANGMEETGVTFEIEDGQGESPRTPIR